MREGRGGGGGGGGGRGRGGGKKKTFHTNAKVGIMDEERRAMPKGNEKKNRGITLTFSSSLLCEIPRLREKL